MAQRGFRNFVLLNGHGGNISKLAIVAELSTYLKSPALKVVGVTYRDLVNKEIEDILETDLG
jgi:creatinine amidohydrolase/Fe(II)-dependent formamide hydrolase-like protein